MATPTKSPLPVLPTGLTAPQYEGIFAGAGTYEGNDAALKGKSWGDAYHALWAANVAKGTPYTPYKVALYIEELIFIQGDIGALVTSVGNFVSISGKSTVGGIDNFDASNPLASIASILSVLTSKAFWTRAGEFAVGGILLYVGLKALATPSGQSVANHSFKDTAKTAAKVVMF